MTISYNKLFKLLIDKGMKKKDLQESARISSATISKLSKNEKVSMDVILKICSTLNANVGDIMEVVDNEKK